jgi:homoserine dehydrogenase
MPHLNLALLGFGNVGQALARLLLRKQDELSARYELTFSVTGIATGAHGTAIDANGIDLKAVLDFSGAGNDRAWRLDSFSSDPAPGDAIDFIRRCGADVLFENTPVNYASGQPAIDHLKTALGLGMHAITANKGPVVYAYRELSELAGVNGRKFYFESAVMDGAPIFSLFREALPVAQLHAIKGVLNSTTNLILTRMETGESFESAVAYAQKIGVAETDPSGDVDGWDAAVKVAALVTVLMGIPLKPDRVRRQGIRMITVKDIERAQVEGKRWKLVCSAKRVGGGVQARVAPELVTPDSPLFQVNGTTSIVQFETDALGLLSVIEENPGPDTTAYGLLADFVNAARS